MFEVLLAILAFGLAFAGGYFIRFHQDKLSEKERIRRNLEDLHRRLLEFSYRLRDAWCDWSISEEPESRGKLAEEIRKLIRETMPMLGHLQQVHANGLSERGSTLYNDAASLISRILPNSDLEDRSIATLIDSLAKSSQNFANDVLGEFALNSPAWASVPLLEGSANNGVVRRNDVQSK